ncbi:MAG TPA: hypothetical protein VM369_09455 [Candidatus Binatia bacterium]|nr:hypothetical protein [Candidatus Binatia bacterium]
MFRISDTPPEPSSLPTRLRGLPLFDPPPGGWQRLQARRRLRAQRFAAVSGGFALAASVLVAFGLVGLRPDPELAAPPHAAATPADVRVAQLITRSQLLEQQLASARPQLAVWSGTRAERAAQLESELMSLDAQLSYADAGNAENLWRNRVRLMNALVQLHQPEAPALQYASYQY